MKVLIKGSNGAVEKRMDPRVKRTRGLIMEAFGELVLEKGHSGLTVQEIAERATVNRATFYAHFADQNELFDNFISEAFREELRRRLPAESGLDKETLKVLVLAVCNYLESLKACTRKDKQFKPLIEARVQKELYELFLGWIEPQEHKVDGRLVTPEVAAAVVSWAVFGVGLQWSQGDANHSAEETASQALSVIFGGLEGFLPHDKGSNY